MKTLKTVMVAMLLTNVGVMAMTTKVKDETKVVYKVLEGDSKEVHGKRGLAVDVKYKSEHVDIGVNANVNITITTGLNEGILKVNVRPLKENTTNLAEKDIEFTLTNGKNSFPVNLELSSEQSGIHYINLTMSVEGEGSRVITVPVNIGTITKSLNNKKVERTDTGIPISVSSAQEEIK
jgi:hypothetical protein